MVRSSCCNSAALGKPSGNSIGISERIDVDGLDGCDANMADAGDVAPLAGPHVAEFPQANGLGFFAGPDRGEEFLFEEQHGTGILVAAATSPNEIDRAAKGVGICYRYLLGTCPCKRVVAAL